MIKKICFSFLTIFVFLFISTHHPLFAADEGVINDSLKRGIAEYQEENYEEALKFFIKARERQPDSSIAAFYLGLVYKQTGDNAEGARYFKDAISLVPSVKDAYTELIEMLFNMNKLKEAQVWIEKAEMRGIKPARTFFQKGLILLKEGHNKKAIAAFNEAKDLDLSLEQAADFQIAIAYSKERRFDDAKESLKAVIAVNPASELAGFAREYEKAFTRVLEDYKAWRVTVSVGYQYDDNVVAKPSTSIGVPVVDEITGKDDSSGVGTLRLDYNPLYQGPWFLNTQFNFASNTYVNTKTHNLLFLSTTAIPGYNFRKGAVSLPVNYSHIMLSENNYMKVFSVKPSLNFMVFPEVIGQFSAGYTIRELVAPPLDINEDRDSQMFNISAGYVYPFSQGKGMFNMRYEFTRDYTEGKNWDSLGHRASMALLVPLPHRVSLTASVDMFLQDYKNTHTAFGIKREDEIYSSSAILKWEIIKSLNISLQYSHIRADSNIAVFDYSRNMYSTKLEYTF